MRGKRRRVERVLEAFVDDALVRGVHVHEDEARDVLREDVDAMELREREAQHRRLRGRG